ncbi:hypothetical protein [Cylindrospermopsis raciborskii]|uniref:hypothetical protein n=1 Tax=Cylindrospermopsis raciborskii TaxID=77022 RepID=UPI001FC9D3B2|nr:hypothetical protein [Cylindrospermopsis raciborskii]
MATTADEVWKLLGELIESQKETERKFQETERFLREQSKKRIGSSKKRTSLREQSQETESSARAVPRNGSERSMTDRQFQETIGSSKKQIVYYVKNPKGLITKLVS